MDKSFFPIFKTFFKIGSLLLGGGYVILPLLQAELSEKKKWIQPEELSEYYAISSSLPGLIAINTSIFAGRKLAGNKGAIAAILGIVMPAFIAIILLASIFTEIAHHKSIQNIFWGLTIGVITLIFLAIKEMWPVCLKNKFSAIIYTISLFMALILNISPVLIVIFAIITGILYTKFKGDKND